MILIAKFLILNDFQVIGRLPFDDSNHRELLKQVKKGPNFPEKREATKECKNLISRILVRKEDRPPISMIGNHVFVRKRVPLEVMQALDFPVGPSASSSLPPIGISKGSLRRESSVSKSGGASKPSSAIPSVSQGKTQTTSYEKRPATGTPQTNPPARQDAIPPVATPEPQSAPYYSAHSVVSPLPEHPT